jgi:hypothetical protein
MGFLKSLMIRVGADTTGVDKELKKASKQLIAAGKDWEKVGSTMTKGLTLPILAVGAAAVKMGLDARDGEEKFAYAFGSMEKSVRAWSDTLSKSRGLDSFNLRATTADFGTLAKGFGFSEMAASKMAKGLGEATFAMAEMYKVDPATMSDAITSAFKGKANALKDYGTVIDDTTTKAYAYAYGIAKLGTELTSAQKAQAMYGQVMAGAADEMAAFAVSGADVADALMNKVNTALKEFGLALVNSGTAEKLVASMTRMLDKAVELAVAFSNLSPGMQDFMIYTGLAVSALGPLINGTAQMVGLFAKLGLSASSAGASMVGLRAGLVGVMAAGTAGLYGTAFSDVNPAWKWSTDLWGKIGLGPKAADPNLIWGGTQQKTGGAAGYGKATRRNSAAEEAGSSLYVAPVRATSGDAILDYMAEYNKLLEEQAAALAEQERAAKSAAAIDTFRSSVQSLAQAMMDASKAFSGWTGAFDKVERQQVSGTRLANRMQGQATAMQDWVTAMGQLKGKVGTALYSELLNMGPGAVDQIRALVNDGEALGSYESAWQKKNDLASGMGREAAGLNYKSGQYIENQVNTINVIGSGNVDAVAAAVVKKLKMSGQF